MFVTSSDAERELKHLTQDVFNLFKPRRVTQSEEVLQWKDVFREKQKIHSSIYINELEVKTDFMSSFQCSKTLTHT